MVEMVPTIFKNLLALNSVEQGLLLGSLLIMIERH